MASKITPVSFTEVPVVYPAENSSGKAPDINSSPFQLLRNEKNNSRDNRNSVIHTLHQAPQKEDKAPIIAVVNRFSHVAPGEDNLHFMIAPNSPKFHTLESINTELLNNMSKTALKFLREAPIGAVVLTHETDHEMVDSPKRTHKSWKQIHWHLRHEDEKQSSKASVGDGNLDPYGNRLIDLFHKEPAIKTSELKTYGFDLAFQTPFPEKPEELSQILKSLDAWARKQQPILALEQQDKIPDDKFMHQPIHTIAFRRTAENQLEIAIMPHIKSPDFSLIGLDGKNLDGITLEPFGHALKRVAVKENPADEMRIRNSIETISRLRGKRLVE